ncbi:uncharacterized protein LOC132032170 [Lycium ferocissimum]|uniref:uncharacterized protein LOC132032170 n=1 Tax=Lycium ferocissimum TaxID=112874 RepID=UPI0028164277|nr:uncharacterized protein LOC132032170 [Lycium ferocissimum]
MTVIYASTNRDTRIALWEDLYDISTHINLPWLVGGDFKVIIEAAEKCGGLPVQFTETGDFRHCIDSCQLMDLGFTGRNQALQNIYPKLEVEHLIKQRSNHSPLLISLKHDSRPIQKDFRFLNFWVEHANFQEVVKNNRGSNYSSDPFYNFHQKLKKVSKALSIWSKENCGDIFKQIATLEKVKSFRNRRKGCSCLKMETEIPNFFMLVLMGKGGDYNLKEFRIVVEHGWKQRKL